MSLLRAWTLLLAAGLVVMPLFTIKLLLGAVIGTALGVVMLR